MHELRFIREHVDLVKEKCRLRGMDLAMLDRFVSLDQSRRDLLVEVEGLRNQRKTQSQEVGALKKAGKETEAETIMAATRAMGDRIKTLEQKLVDVDAGLTE